MKGLQFGSRTVRALALFDCSRDAIALRATRHYSNAPSSTLTGKMGITGFWHIVQLSRSRGLSFAQAVCSFVTETAGLSGYAERTLRVSVRKLKPLGTAKSPHLILRVSGGSTMIPRPRYRRQTRRSPKTPPVADGQT